MDGIKEGYFPEKEEITRGGFISHMKGYIKGLLTEPVKARPDEYLRKYGIDWKEAQEMLLSPTEGNDPESSVLRRENKIIQGYDGKDRYQVVYRLPRKDFMKKLRRLYINRFEGNIISELRLNEEGEGGGGATSADASGQFSQPLFGKPIKRRTVYITEEQANTLSEATTMAQNAGDMVYDAPAFAPKGDPSMDHRNMFRKSWRGE